MKSMKAAMQGVDDSSISSSTLSEVSLPDDKITASELLRQRLIALERGLEKGGKKSIRTCPELALTNTLLQDPLICEDDLRSDSGSAPARISSSKKCVTPESLRSVSVATDTGGAQSCAVAAGRARALPLLDAAEQPGFKRLQTSVHHTFPARTHRQRAVDRVLQDMKHEMKHKRLSAALNAVKSLPENVGDVLRHSATHLADDIQGVVDNLNQPNEMVTETQQPGALKELESIPGMILHAFEQSVNKAQELVRVHVERIMKDLQDRSLPSDEIAQQLWTIPEEVQSIASEAVIEAALESKDQASQKLDYAQQVPTVRYAKKKIPSELENVQWQVDAATAMAVSTVEQAVQVVSGDPDNTGCMLPNNLIASALLQMKTAHTAAAQTSAPDASSSSAEQLHTTQASKSVLSIDRERQGVLPDEQFTNRSDNREVSNVGQLGEHTEVGPVASALAANLVRLQQASIAAALPLGQTASSLQQREDGLVTNLGGRTQSVDTQMQRPQVPGSALFLLGYTHPHVQLPEELLFSRPAGVPMGYVTSLRHLGEHRPGVPAADPIGFAPIGLQPQQGCLATNISNRQQAIGAAAAAAASSVAAAADSSSSRPPGNFSSQQVLCPLDVPQPVAESNSTWEPAPEQIQDESQSIAESADMSTGSMARFMNRGSLGHPELCARPCLYFHKNGGCAHGMHCDFCHFQHPRRPAHLDKKHRDMLKRMSLSDCLLVILPILQEKLQDLDIDPKATELVEHFEQQLLQSGVRPPKSTRPLVKALEAFSIRSLMSTLRRMVPAETTPESVFLEDLMVYFHKYVQRGDDYDGAASVSNLFGD
mmetsp:Transcript_142903/g.274418  ORF Transcript_142903/g.274418 Transcript_142903/m.274418 type:complete len:825 (-) Transcript_142903:36-2510(-)